MVELELCQKLAKHLFDQEWTNIEEGSDESNIPFLAESIKGFLDAQAPAPLEGKDPTRSAPAPSVCEWHEEDKEGEG